MVCCDSRGIQRSNRIGNHDLREACKWSSVHGGNEESRHRMGSDVRQQPTHSNQSRLRQGCLVLGLRTNSRRTPNTMIPFLVAGFIITASTIIGAALWAARESDRLLAKYFEEKETNDC